VPEQARRMRSRRSLQPVALVKRAVLCLPAGPRKRVFRSARWARHVLEMGIDEEEADRQRFFKCAFFALSFNGISGDYVEFGSWTARTFRLAYDASRHVGHQCLLWSFDSFAGLPEPEGALDEHPHWIRGDMATSLPEFEALVRDHGIPPEAYRVVPGWYEATLGRQAQGERPADICLAYIDCDLYSSTRLVLEFLHPLLKHGMILALDDYFAYSATEVSGERRAVHELLSDHPRFRLVPFLRFGWASMAFVVEDRALLPGASGDV
jgi:O-methyltransferase